MDYLLHLLKNWFDNNAIRHQGIDWPALQERLDVNLAKLWSLNTMEENGGDHDVAGIDKQTGEYIFYHCTAESPKGCRSYCYEDVALAARKENKPKGIAVDMAEAMGIDLLTEAEYRALQQLGPVDTKTSSWLLTPPENRKLGGAIFGDYRYGHGFIYHNVAESCYAAGIFRAWLRVKQKT